MRLIQILLGLIAPVVVTAGCYTAGPAFPPVHRILSERHFEQLRSKLDSVIPDVLANPDGWTTNTTSFAIQVTSTNQSLWSSYYTAPILGEYIDSEPTPVTGDTAFRIASVSKSFTVYAALLESKINFDDPITKYIPELADLQKENLSPWAPEWDEITIRSLASQLSGIAREGGLSELAADSFRLPDPISQGFPPVDERQLSPCLKNTTDRPCNSSEIIWLATTRPKVFETNGRSTYSNIAFSLLGQALERATGKPYSDIISSSILQPLGMNHTRTTKPKDSMGIIPHGFNDWRLYLDAETPTGGIYSTANDLTLYLQSILSSKLLPRATTNAWMKPRSWSTEAASAYGMPWEMFRTTKLTPDKRAVDIVTKGGDLNRYDTIIAMIPEYGLGITILTAGDASALADLEERIISKLVPAVDELLRSELRAKYAGTYVGYKPGWSLELEVDHVGPGLLVKEWVSNYTDFLPVYGSLKRMGQSGRKWEARLVPSGIYVEPGRVEWETWRLTTIQGKSIEDEGKVFEDYCIRDVDALMYNGISVEQFDIGKEGPPWAAKEVSMIMSAGMRTLFFKVLPGTEGKASEDLMDHRAGLGYVGADQVPLMFR